LRDLKDLLIYLKRREVRSKIGGIPEGALGHKRSLLKNSSVQLLKDSFEKRETTTRVKEKERGLEGPGEC